MSEQQIFSARYSKPQTMVFRWLIGLAALAGETLATGQGLQGPPVPDLPTIERQLPSSTPEDAATAVVARVDGTPIFQNEIDRTFKSVETSQKLDSETRQQVQATILQQLIDRMLVRQYVISHKLLGTDAEVDVAVAQLQAGLQQRNSTLNDFLTRTHQSEDSLRTMFAQELGWKKYVAKNTTDEALQAFFKKYHEQFDGTQRRVSHILLRPDGTVDPAKIKALIEQAQSLRDTINSGKLTFEAAAEKYSAGPSRSRGGDLGYVPLKGVMVDSFSQAAFAAKPGEISEPLLAPFGVHLIKVTDVKTGKKTWQDVREALQPAFSDAMFQALAKDQAGKTTIEFSRGVPHFKRGTNEVEVSDSTVNLQ